MPLLLLSLIIATISLVLYIVMRVFLPGVHLSVLYVFITSI